jgi:predicted acylesterase/phospholipase RssA/CRP-like cAMP-binding protein
MPEPSRVDRLHLLSGRPFLRGLGPHVLKSIDAALESTHVPGGERVVERGQTGVPLILVLQGGVRGSFVGSDGRSHPLFESFRGGSVGEALLVSGRPSPIDIYAVRDSHLLRLHPDKFEGLAKRYPELMRNVARFVASRVIDVIGSHEFLASFCHKADRLPRSVALLGVGGDDVHWMRTHVAESLSRSCVTKRLTLDDARQATGGGGGVAVNGNNDRLSDWFDDLTAQHDLLVLQCDAADSSWSDFCLRQADRILVVVGAEQTGRDMRWWHDAKLGQQSAHVEVAVVHPRGCDVPSGGAAWAHLPGVGRLHHVRAGNARDAGRLARWLSDRPVGVVLSGGGAYGIAHVGVLKALEEADVPVDIIGGTSMGAIFAGGLARGWSADQIMDHVRELFARRFALYDPTIPFKSLLAGRKLDRVLRGLFEDLTIIDLWIPFFCVATSIVQGEPQVRDQGALRDAIRSSCSIPGLFPPFRALQDLLVDGGIVDNLPIGVMSQRCRGPVIAVDVFPYQRHGPGGRPGPVSRFLQWLRPTASRGMPLFDTLMHATLAGSQQTTEMARASHPPTLYLTPELDEFRILDWGAYEGMFRKGYECAKRQLDAGALPRKLWAGPFEYATVR